MDVVSLDIPDVKLLRPRRFGDTRGFFSEIYNQRRETAAGIPMDFVQDNVSLSQAVGTIRGLHFQFPPQTQAKLVMALRGRVLDVAVDCRKGSPTYGRHVTAELDAEEWTQIFVPAGFAHGFCTLEPDTLVLYKVTALYAPELDSGILWNDPDLGIAWPVTEQTAVVSDKDKRLPRFRDLADQFSYAGAS
jgi:dTDP-4-dehydrorhamnose 3,5-epimerase